VLMMFSLDIVLMGPERSLTYTNVWMIMSTVTLNVLAARTM